MLQASKTFRGNWMKGNWIKRRFAHGAVLPRTRALAQSGFTVIELMIGIAVLAIVMGLAVPAFTQFIQNNRLAAKANEVVGAFQFARAEALKRGLPVRVCSSSDGNGCNGEWNEGWVAIADPGGTDEEVLRRWPTPGDDFQFTPTSGYAGFDPSGFSTSSTEQTFSLMLDGCTNDSARDILVEATGRVASERVDCPTS